MTDLVGESRELLGLTDVERLRTHVPARRDVAARTHPGVAVVDRWADALSVPGVEAAIIATPVSTHVELTELALAAGKHVLVEKPMALSASECDAMIAACREARVPLRVAYYRRKLPRFEKMRSLMKAPVVFDGRNIYSPEQMRGLGFTYFSIGR